MEYTPDEQRKLREWEIPARAEQYALFKRMNKEERYSLKGAYEEMLVEIIYPGSSLRLTYDYITTLEMKITMENLEILRQIEEEERR
jgi:hypothetical protein